MKKKTKTILLAGGNGLIAQDLINFLLLNNFKIISISRKSLKKKINHKNFKFIKHDLSKPLILKKKIDLIVNSIATHEFSKKKNLSHYFESNVLCIKNLIDLAKKNNIKKFINLSTITIYKKTPHSIKENSPLDNLSLLGQSKFLGEKILEIENINYINLRLPGILDLDKENNQRPWLKKIIFEIKTKKKNILIFNSKKKFNSLVDTQEIAEFIKFICKSNKNYKVTLNFAGKNPLMLCNLINILKKFYNYKNNLIYKENNEQSSSIININKLLRLVLKFHQRKQ